MCACTCTTDLPVMGLVIHFSLSVFDGWCSEDQCMQCIRTIQFHMEQAGHTIILSPPPIMGTPSQNSKILIDYSASVGQVDVMVMGPQLG